MPEKPVTIERVTQMVSTDDHQCHLMPRGHYAKPPSLEVELAQLYNSRERVRYYHDFPF